MCSHSYRGPNPGSEAETQALINYLSSSQNGVFPHHSQQQEENALNSGKGDYNPQFTPGKSATTSSKKWKGYTPSTTQGVFADFHSFGEGLIFPWGNQKSSIAPNDISYRSIMGQLKHMIGGNYIAHQAGPTHFGVAAGCTDDWAYGTLGALRYVLHIDVCYTHSLAPSNITSNTPFFSPFPPSLPSLELTCLFILFPLCFIFAQKQKYDNRAW